MLNTNKLKGAIISAGYTQKSFAEKLGISKNSLNLKVNGRSNFTLDEVDKICEILGISDVSKKVEIFLETQSQ